MSGQPHTPSASSPGKEPRVPIGYEVEWAPDPSGRCGEMKEKSLTLAGNQNLG
jgi:hypothetical protein